MIQAPPVTKITTGLDLWVIGGKYKSNLFIIAKKHIDYEEVHKRTGSIPKTTYLLLTGTKISKTRS